MGKREKGRRHRRVNRTPRPVGRSGTDRAAQRSAGGPAPAAVGQGSVALPPQGVGACATGDPVPGPQASAFASKADGGLGQPAQRTWSALRAPGVREISVQDLCDAVGFTPRTVLKHLKGLAAHGLAAQGPAGGWQAADPVRSLHDPLSRDPEPAGAVSS